VAYTRRVVNSRVLALLVVVGVSGAAGLSAWIFLPKMEYLPEGNRNLVIGRITPPPGYNLPTTTEIAGEIEAAVRPLWASESAVAEDGQGEALPLDDLPQIRRFFFVALPSLTIIGAISADPERVSELIPVIQNLVYQEPGA